MKNPVLGSLKFTDKQMTFSWHLPSLIRWNTQKKTWGPLLPRGPSLTYPKWARTGSQGLKWSIQWARTAAALAAESELSELQGQVVVILPFLSPPCGLDKWFSAGRQCKATVTAGAVAVAFFVRLNEIVVILRIIILIVCIILLSVFAGTYPDAISENRHRHR